MRIDTSKKYQLWTYSDGGYHLKEFDTLEAALEEDKYGGNFYITKSVSFSVIEDTGDDCRTVLIEEARKIVKDMILNEMQPTEERIRKAAREAAEDQNKMVEEARKISNE